MGFARYSALCCRSFPSGKRDNESPVFLSPVNFNVRLCVRLRAVSLFEAVNHHAAAAAAARVEAEACGTDNYEQRQARI